MIAIKSNYKCFKCGQLRHQKFECQAKKTISENKERRRWCDHCKSSTLDTTYCHKKLKEHSAKAVMDKDKDREQGEHSIAFKVTVNQQGCDPEIDSLNSLLVDTGATTHIITVISRFCSFDSSFVED